MLLTAFVVDQQFVDANSGSINISNSTIDVDSDGTPEFDSIVFDDATISGVGGVGINVNLSDLTLNRIVFQGVQLGDQATGDNQTSGINITLNNIDLEAIAFDDTTVFSGFGGGVDVDLTDVQVRDLTFFDSSVIGGLNAGVSIDVASVSRNASINELAISGTTIDGLSITAVGLQKPVIGVSQTNPIVVTVPDHGLQTGAEVKIQGVGGVAAANTRATITVLDENTFSLDNVDGSLESAYSGGGTLTATTDLNNVRIVESNITGTSGQDGIAISLTDARAPGLTIQENVAIDSIDLSMTRTPIDGLQIRDNETINANRPQVNAINFDLNESTLTNIVIDGNVVDGSASASGGEGVVFNSVDSNVYGSFANNTVQSTLGSGLKFVGSASAAFQTENRGPLVFDFSSLFAETSLTATATANATTLQVVDGRAFQAQQVVLIGDEQLFVEAVSGNTLTVRRGERGTLALEHASGSRVRSVSSSASGVPRTISGNTFDSNSGAGVSADLAPGASLVADLTTNTFLFNEGGGVDVTAKDTRAVETEIARGGISRTSTTLNVVDASVFGDFETPFDIAIEGEVLTVTSISGNTLTVLRGVNGTAASFHDTNTKVYSTAGDGFVLNIGGVSDADGNIFDRNLTGAISVTLQDEAAGVVDIRNNVIVSTDDPLFNRAGNGTVPTDVQSEAHAIEIQLVGTQVDDEATAILRRSTIDGNLIGARTVALLATDVPLGSSSFSVDDASVFVAGEQVRIDSEVLTIAGISTVTNVLTLTGGTTQVHAAGAPILPLTGINDGVTTPVSASNEGRGIDVFFEEQTAVEDLQITNNFIVANQNDGVRIRREDDGVARTVNPAVGQNRAITIASNTINANAENPTEEVLDPGVTEEFGAGVEIISLNGSQDVLDVEVRDNSIIGNRNGNAGLLRDGRGVLIRAEADSQVLVDIIRNTITFHDGDGIRYETREDSATDLRDITGRILSNTISMNDGDGIDLQGHFGFYQDPVVIGQAGVDSEGRSLGNIITNNQNHGIQVIRGGNLTVTNNDLSGNGRGRDARLGQNTGSDVSFESSDGGATSIIGSGLFVSPFFDPIGSQDTVNIVVDQNTITGNTQMGIDINAETGATNVFSTIRDNQVTGNLNDGIEISGSINTTLLGNDVQSNAGRGLDILNYNSSDSNYLIGDGLETGRNTFVGNGHEGVFYVNSAESQNQNLISSDPDTMRADGSIATSPNAILQIDTNTISDNGQTTTFSASGLVMRIGSADGGTGFFDSNDPGDEVGVGAPYGDSNSALGLFGTISARTNARVVSNAFEGNFGDDVQIIPFVSTVDPGHTTGEWHDAGQGNSPNFAVGTHNSDPLARLNLDFSGNSGNGIDVISPVFLSSYDSLDRTFKSRDSADSQEAGQVDGDGSAGGPFPNGVRERSITQIPARTGQGIGFWDGIAGFALEPIVSINPADTPVDIVDVRDGVLAVDGTEDLIVTTATPHGFTDGFGGFASFNESVQIAGVRGQTAIGSQLHTANGSYYIDVLSPTTFSLRGTAGHGGPDYSFGGTATQTPGGTFLYPGVGPSTLRIANGFDTSGSNPQNEFDGGDNFTDTTITHAWETWVPLDEVNGVITDVQVSPTAGSVRITSPNHGLNTHRTIRIDGVLGAEEINTNSTRVTVIDADTFDIVGGLDDPYIQGGEWVTVDHSFIAPASPTFALTDVVDVSPDPLASNVGVVTVNFTEPITNVSIDDFRLTRDGRPVDISGISVVQVTPQQYTLDLSSVTAAEGQYNLTVDNTFPEASIVAPSDTSLLGPIGVVTINFTENVTGVDITDFILTRDVGDGNGAVAQNLTALQDSNGVFGANLAVTQVSASQYSIDLSGITDEVGSYRLSLLAPRADVTIDPIVQPNSAGNPIVIRSQSPHGLSTGMEVTIDEVRNDYATGADARPNGEQFIITVLDEFEFELNGTTSNGANASGGVWRFDPEIVDEVGRPYGIDNSSRNDPNNPTLADATITWSRANAAPVADIVDIAPDPRNTALDTARVVFSEPVRITQVNVTDFRLTRDIGNGLVPLDINGTASISAVDPDPTGAFATTFELTNLSSFTGQDATYRLRLITTDSSRITDQQGSLLQFEATDEWVMVTTGPAPFILPVFPDPRPNQPVNPPLTIPVSFNEAVTGVDLADAATHFTLLRDIGDGNGPQNVPLINPANSQPLTITMISGTDYQVDLTPVVQDAGGVLIDGTYTFTLNRGTGITAVSDGEELAVDAFDTWVQDGTAPTAEILDLTPNPRVADAGIVTVRFSEQVVGVASLNAATDFQLTLDIGDGNGPQPISIAGIPVRPIAPVDFSGTPVADPFSAGLYSDTFVIDLSDVTAVDGRYVLSLQDSGGVVDRAGNTLTATAEVGSLSGGINASVTTITTDDGQQYRREDIIEVDAERMLVLAVSGNGLTVVRAQDGTAAASHADGAVIRKVTSTVWTLIAKEPDSPIIDSTFPVPAVVTNPRVVDPAFSLQRQLIPNAAVGDAVETFFVDVTPPSVVPGSVNVTPDPRSTAVGILTIDFTEPVAGFNLTDLVLTRDGNPVSLNGLTLNQVTQSRYTIDLNLTTGAPGDYVLSIQGAGSLIEDLAGNPISATLINLDSWTVENIGPSATVSVTPDPRTTPANNVQVSFTKEVEVAQVDVSDFKLERDTGSGFTDIVLTGASIVANSPSGGFDDSFTLDLSAAGLTDVEATYRLTLVASDSGIVDLAGIELTSDASDIWVLDNTNPTVDIIDIAPDPRQTEVQTVNIIFNEGVTGVDIADFVLLKDSAPVDISGLTVTQQTALRYTLDLSSVTTDDATYELRLVTTDGATPIQDLGGNALLADGTLGVADTAALDGWFKGVDIVNPTVDIVDVSTPRANAVGIVTLRFSEDVVGVDINDIELELDTGSGSNPVDISGLVVNPSPGSATEYQLDLSTVTSTQGTYTLRVVTTDVGSPIVDAAGNALAQSFGAGVADEITFVVQTIDPAATIETVTPDPRLRAVGVLSVTFSQPVQGVDLADFTLTRDTGSGAQPVSLRNATLEQSPAGADEYFLDLSKTTGSDGVYTLTLTAEGSGITAISTGDPMTSDAIESWATITTITVNTMNDTVDVSPGDGVVADSSGNVSLRAAIMEANALAGDDVVVLPAGEYTLSIGGVGEDFGASGDLDVRDVGSRLTIRGAGADVTTIDAASLERVFHVFAGATLDIEGVTITGGLVTGSEDGGGLRNDGGTVTITDSVITGNVSQDDAGGINNTGNLTLTRVTVSDNSAARTGGGVRNSGQLTIVESTIGGEHDATDPLAPDFRNTAVLGGGGIINLTGGTLTASNSTISGNVSTTSQGAGLFSIGRGTLTNVTVSNNEAAAEGGGIAVAGGLTELRNTVVAGNVSTTSTVDIFDATAGASLDSSGNNLIGDNTGAAVAFPDPAPNPNPNLNGDFVGTAATPIDPLLGALTDNGGATLTHSPLFGSPLIDAGGLTSSVLDQRGITRDLNGVDIGAVEFGGFFVNSTADSIDVNPGDGIVADSFGRRTLRAAIMEANALPGENAIQLGEGTHELSLTEIDTTPPTADIVDVTPDPLSAQSTLLDPVDEIVVNFSEPVQGIDLLDASTNFTLTFDDGTGPVPVPLTGITVRQDSDTQYVLEGLTTLLSQDGLYDLRLITTGITDFALAPNTLTDDLLAPAANVGAFDSFVRGADVFAPTAILSQVTTPRTTNPGAVSLTFSESVFGVDLSSNPANFSLAYDDDGGAGPNAPQVVALNAVAVQQITASEYVLDLTTVLDFSGLTDPGEYSLTFDGTATTIFDFSANQFTGTPLSTTWVIQPDTTPPSADIVDISPDPRIGAVGVTTIDFTEDVTGVDLANADTDFDLFRDIDGFGAGAAATKIDISGLTVTQVTDSQYTVDLSTVTAGDGEYRFVVRTDGMVRDLAGALLDSTLGAGDVAEDFWATGDTFVSVSSVDAASFGDLDITSGDLVIIGSSESTSIIDANQIDRVFDVFSGTSLSLQNLTVTGGQTVGGNDGGGVRSFGTLAVADSTLTGNTTDANGGAIYTAAAGTASTLSGNITATDAALAVSNVAVFPTQPGFVILVGNEQMRVESINGAVFSVTRAVNGSTATVHSAGATVSLVDLSLSNTTIVTNNADFGAGVFNDGGTVTVTGSSIENNVAATDGGGVYNDRTATLNVVGSTLVLNSSGRDGGGVYNNDSATTSISDSTLNGNIAVRNGGGLFNEIVAVANLNNTRFSANTAGDGGGVYNEDGQVVISGGSLIANVSSGDGGGLLATSSAVTTVDGTSISGNRSAGDGGAFANDGSLNISNSTVASNTADGDGAAIANSSVVSIDTVTFSANAAVGSGGAIYNQSVGNVNLAASTISNNTAGADGGGIANVGSARLTFGTSTLDGNTAGNRGGGLFHSSAVTATVTEGTISNNSAANGGGIGALGAIQATNSTVSGNQASANGGGINNGADSTYLNVTIVNNSADANGGGVFNSSLFGPARLKNTIVARNTAATGADVNGDGFVSQGNNLIGDGSTVTVFVNGIGGNLVGATGTEIDPLISPLQDNGGATVTHALLFGSPARDAGNNVGVTANDQRGFDRRFDGDGDGTSTVDIGAFESGLTVNSFLDTVDVNPGDRSSADLAGNSTLRAAIMEANAQPGADSIVLLPGTYRLTLAGRDENNALAGDLDVTETLTIIGAGDGSTIIDAAGLDRAFHVIAGASLNLMGVTVINGDADLGGAILNQGELNLQNVSVSDSSARLGGGIYNDITQGELDGSILAGDTTITVSDVTDFPRQAGFTITIDSEELRVDSISGSTFTVTRGVNGTVANAHVDGATVTFSGTATVSLNDANVINNEALLNGGGIYNNDQLVISTSTVSSNVAGVRGGGIYNTETVTIDESTLDGNLAEVNGGAIYNEGTVNGAFSSVTITGSTLSNNEAGVQGGAIFNSDRLTLNNSTISGNSTGSEGGAIYNTGVSQQVTSTVAQASLTVVLDFIEPGQAPFVDAIGNPQGAFDVTAFGFQASEFDIVTQAVLDTVNQHYLAIPTSDIDGRSPIPQDMQLDIEFVIGDVGTAPSNGATEFYYVTIGSDLSGTAPLGVAFLSSIRNAAGNPNGAFNSGDPVGTVYSDNIQGLGGLTPSNALTSGDLFFTANAIAGTTSHEIGHALSLLHLNSAGAVTPTGAGPIMGTGAIDTPNQARILTREFAYTGQNAQAGGATQMHVQQLVGALGLRAAPVTSQSPGVGFLNISNSTIVNNTSDLEGGGIVNATGSTAQLRNSIVAANVANNANATALNADNDVRGAFTSLNTNFIGDSGTASGFINGFRGDQVGSEFSPLDPVFGALASNGGGTQTHELLPGSPAIDAGDNSGGEPTDQRNGQRPTDTTADIGAFEVQQNSLRITDVTAVEGNSGSTEFIFSVVLDVATAEPITVSYGTIQGTATQGSDFLGMAGTLVFAPGELSKTITVEVNGDTTTESNEEFIVQLFNPINAVVSDGQGVGTILNDDAIVTFADVEVVEGDSGSATATFNVVLSNATSESISLGYQTAAGTATPGLSAVGGDYIEASGTLTFAPGETSKSFTVAVNGDTTVEDFETFVANLTLTSGSVQLPDPQAVGTIQNDDIAFVDISDETVTELTGANNSVSFTVALTTLNAFDVTVDVQTVDGTATSGNDYVALPPTTVTIPAGMLSVTQDVTVIGDTDFEGGATGTPETFDLEYVMNTITRDGGIASGTLGNSGTASITDDELPPTVWVIRVNGAGTQGEVLRDGTDDGVFNPLFVRNFNLTGASETVDGDPGTQNDRFIVDFVNGNPIPDGGLFINGGDQTSGDSLEVIDGSGTFTFDSVVYTSTDFDAGTILIDDGDTVPLVRTITYDELEPVLDTVAAVDRTFTINSVANPGDHRIDVADAGGRTIISDNGTTAFESVEFANPTNSLTLNAGDGSNTITVGALDATFAAAVNAGTRSVTINAEDGADNLDATATNIALSLVGGDGADTLLSGGQMDTIDGGAGNDSLDGGAGNDSLVGGADDDIAKGGAGIDTIDGGAGNDSIEGGADGDTLIGGTEDDTILGEDGDDNIDGGTGADSLDGGAGNDTITGGDGGDEIAGGSGQDSLDGGGDADTIDGGADNDVVLGGSGTDVVAGGDGDDSVDGGADNDTLSGGGGMDTLNGGTGDDQVSEVAVDAESIVLTDTTLTVGGLADSVTSVDEFILTGGDLSSFIDASGYTLGNVTISGEGGDDTLIGSQGDDFINGGSGNDTLTGGLGNDSMLGGAGSDSADGGSANDTLIGNSGNDTLNGGAGLDSIDGGSGNDIIDGGDDSDTVLAGAGSDSVDGGLGNDRILGQGQDDTLNGDDGDDTLIGGTGGDMIRGGAGIDNLNGNSGRDDLDGGADDDTAFGGAGQDTLTGGQGIDNLDGQGSSFDTIRIVGEATDDVFTLDRSNNFNLLRKTSGTTYGVNFKRTETIEINTFDGNDTINVIGDLLGSDGDAAFVVDFGNGNNSLDASLNTDAGKRFVVTAGTGNDTLVGSAGDDNLNGASGDDSIEGGSGEDTLTGAAGADVLNGGAGADLINGGTENDTISGGSEIDTLNAGDGDDSVRGGDGNDLINGEDGNDLLYGDAGNDSILGGRDDDSIDGGANDDTIFGERGFDVIKGGDGTDSLVGGDHNDTIDGGNGNDLVNGNLGNDVLLGGADNDTILGGSDADTLVGGTGADDIRGQGSSGDIQVGETALAGTADDTPDAGDTFDSVAEIDNAFVLDTAILDKLNSF